MLETHAIDGHAGVTRLDGVTPSPCIVCLCYAPVDASRRPTRGEIIRHCTRYANSGMAACGPLDEKKALTHPSPPLPCATPRCLSTLRCDRAPCVSTARAGEPTLTTPVRDVVARVPHDSPLRAVRSATSPGAGGRCTPQLSTPKRDHLQVSAPCASAYSITRRYEPDGR